MKISVYVDGSGGSSSGYGYFVKETGESFYEKKPDLTNNQAEYLAIISALNKFVNSTYSQLSERRFRRGTVWHTGPCKRGAGPPPFCLQPSMNLVSSSAS